MYFRVIYLKPESSKVKFQYLDCLQSIIQLVESLLDTKDNDSYSWLLKYFILFSYSNVQEDHLLAG